MPRRTFTLTSNAPPDRTLDAIRKALVESGYREEKRDATALVVSRNRREMEERWEPPHTIRITASEASDLVDLELDTPLGTPPETASALEERLRFLLRRHVPSRTQTRKGVVSRDGTRVDLDEAAPWASFAASKNVTSDQSRGMQVLFVGSAALFSVVSAAYVWDMLRRHEPVNAFLLAMFLLFAVLPVGALLGPALTCRTPRTVLVSLHGVEADVRSRGNVVIPWDRVQGVAIDRFDTAGHWLFWTDREGRTRRLKLSTEKAGEVRWTHRFVKGGLAGGRAAFEAFNLAPPGANVLVAERGLTDEEARYRKLFRRYLPFGPASIALYVSAEEDVRLVSEYVERMTLTPEDLKGIARGAIGQSMWELAGNVLEKALAQLPEDEDVVYELAGCLMRSGRPQEGLDRLEGFLSRGQGSGRTHTMRGLLLMELQRPEEAFHSVGKAVELDPNETDALNLWFDLVANEAGIPQAVAEIDVVASQRPEAWGPNLVLGQRLLPMGRTDEGIERLRRADAIGRNDETVQALGSSLLGSERVDEAIDVLEKAGELRELGPGAILVLAQAYAARGDAGAALETVELFNPEKDPKWKPAFDALRSRIAT